MAAHIKLTIILSLIGSLGFAQSDISKQHNLSNIFERIAIGVKDFQLDTSATPNDKITKKIIELRNLRGGFNINEMVEFKIEEDRQKNEIPKDELDKISNFFKLGDGKRWLDNATIWIYRKEFSYPELKKLVKFYKTAAGQKMATEFPLIMVKSLKAAEMIKEFYAKQH